MISGHQEEGNRKLRLRPNLVVTSEKMSPNRQSKERMGLLPYNMMMMEIFLQIKEKSLLKEPRLMRRSLK